MNVSVCFTRNYQNNPAPLLRQNKPNSNPISEKAKMSANVYSTKNYEDNCALGLPQNKPKQTQCRNSSKSKARGKTVAGSAPKSGTSYLFLPSFSLVTPGQQLLLWHIMNTFCTNTLGCKVNQYESQQIRELLEQLGLCQVELAQKPDLVVINTCCVTRTASAKSRQYIRRAQKLNPDAAVVVCGCLPIVQIGELNEHRKNVIAVRRQEYTAEMLTQIVKSNASGCDSQSLQFRLNTSPKADDDPNVECGSDVNALPELPQLTVFKGQTRAFLKVQDGCDGYCSYCIVPQTRPHVRSKPPEAVLTEARALVEAGHKEIIVTGVFLGAYGQKSVRRKNWADGRNDRLADLLDKLAQIPNLARIRLSSLEPADVTPRLLDTFSKHGNIMPHLHLSLQSGSNAILEKMCRQYNADDFRRKVQLIKSHLDRPAITTDIIVGFPGETDADFEQTVGLAKEAGFAKMHVFTFSARRGTAAARMQDKVDAKVMKERSQILRDLGLELGRKFRQQFVGETATILLESSDAQPQGRSERYFIVYLENTTKDLKRNDLVRVRLLENSKNGALFGTPIKP